MSDFKTLLQKYVPEYHKGDAALDQYLEALSEFLEGFRSSIDDLKNNNNIAILDSNRLTSVAKTFDIDFLRNIGLSKKRQFVQEAIDLYRTNGTEKSLIRIFRLIGWQIVIDYCWIVDPAYYTEQSITDYYLENDSGGTVVLKKYDVVYGRRTIVDGETFVNLKDSVGNQYLSRPIYGEAYRTYVSAPYFMKVPYLRIQVTSSDYDAFTSDYLDPVTKKVYSYTQSEKFQILQDIKDFFLEQSRPANVAIFEISTPETFEDTISFTFVDDLDITTINSHLKIDGTHLLGQYSVDRYTTGESMGGFELGTTTMDYYGVGEVRPDQTFTLTYPKGTTGFQNFTLLREKSTLMITVPADARVNIMGSVKDGKQISLGHANWTFITSVSNKTNYVISVSDQLAVALNIVTPSSIGNITLNVGLISDRDPGATPPTEVASNLRFGGVDGSTTFTDETGLAWDVTGGAKISSDHQEFHPTCGYIPTTSGYIQTNSASKINLGAGDFAIEFLYWPVSVPANGYGSPVLELGSGTDGNDGFALSFQSNKKMYLKNSYDSVVSSGQITPNAWNRVAITRHSGNLQVVVGASNWSASLSNSPNLNSSKVLTIGNYTGTWLVPGAFYISDFVVTVGKSKYIENNIPKIACCAQLLSGGVGIEAPASLLLFEGNDGDKTIIDESGRSWFSNRNGKLSSNHPKYGQTCGYVPGSLDYFRTSPGSEITLGSGDFVVEFYFWPTASPPNGYGVPIFELGDGTEGDDGFALELWDDRSMWIRNSYGNIHGTGFGTITMGTWNHIAVVMHNDALRVVANGSHWSPPLSHGNQNFNTPKRMTIGAYHGQWLSSKPFYIDAFRVSVDVSPYVYPETFTPPSLPYTGLSTGIIATCGGGTGWGNNWGNDWGGSGTQKFYEFNIINPSASDGTAGWISTQGGLGSRDGYFFGGTSAETRAHQDVGIPSEYIPIVSSGNTRVRVGWQSGGFASQIDSGEMEVIFLDSSGNTISTKNSGLIVGTTVPSPDTQHWFFSDVPANTATVRIQMHAVRDEGTDNNGYFDEISATLLLDG